MSRPTSLSRLGQLFVTKRPAVLGAMSKALATIVTQPLIVAKVGLQSKPPRARNGKPFKSFTEVMKFIVEREGALGLFKGIGPQILKGLLVQGILMMTKERWAALPLVFCSFQGFFADASYRVELLLFLFLRSLQATRRAQLRKVAGLASMVSQSPFPSTRPSL